MLGTQYFVSQGKWHFQPESIRLRQSTAADSRPMIARKEQSFCAFLRQHNFKEHNSRRGKRISAGADGISLWAAAVDRSIDHDRRQSAAAAFGRKARLHRAGRCERSDLSTGGGAAVRSKQGSEP
jgi:hypothetical protein